MIKILSPLTLLFFISFFYCSCLPSIDSYVDESQEQYTSIQDLDIPEGFDFSTNQEIIVNINDDAPYAKYDVFAYSDDRYLVGTETFENQSGEIVTEPVYKSNMLQNLVFTGVVRNRSLVHKISIPCYYDKLYIRRKENAKYHSRIVDIVDGEAEYAYLEEGGRPADEDVADFLYCVNGSAELFQVDPLDGNLTYLSDMPMGSYTAAIDQENKTLYSIGRSDPYPLMKYSIEENSWETVAEIGVGGPRLDYNDDDGLLYFSKQDKLYTFDPSNGDNLDTWDIEGLHNLAGGDLAFSDDGTLFMCTFSGLYELQLIGDDDDDNDDDDDDDDEYQATRISADNLPFQPTSMTFDSNQELWLANMASSSDLIIMDTQTGGWQYEYGINANNDTDLGRTINDLTTYRVFTENTDNIDSDGDGILDKDDSYPLDDEKAFETYTPSKYGKGTLAFEDLWPSNGDYDLNDLAVNYRVTAILNAQNLVVQLDFLINVTSIRAAFTNGLGIEFESVEPDQISNVTGNSLIHNYITQDNNGTESEQENAVIIIFDDPYEMFDNETTISVSFTEPLTTDELGTAPFNPFIIIDKTREREVHLANGHTTSLGVKNFIIEGVNRDEDGNYLNDNGLPWAIDIMHDFKVPTEKTPINEAYNFFSDWAISGGTSYIDWYKDNPGYRNESKIEY